MKQKLRALKWALKGAYGAFASVYVAVAALTSAAYDSMDYIDIKTRIEK